MKPAVTLKIRAYNVIFQWITKITKGAFQLSRTALFFYSPRKKTIGILPRANTRQINDCWLKDFFKFKLNKM